MRLDYLLDMAEEVFVRGGAFKRVIPRIYNYTCCISGMRVDATINLSMVDACHIIPFSESYDDTISNSITLCPNLHRAFDRGIISISDDYRVIVSSAISEKETNYSIRQFEGMRINLTDDNRCHPGLENFRWHRKFHKDKFC